MYIHRGGFQQISNTNLKQFWKTRAPPLAGKGLSCKSIQIDNQPQDIKYSDVVEDVVLIHSSDETKIKKHLEAFGRLIEFGFEPPSKIHTALTECDLDYEKALEQNK